MSSINKSEGNVVYATVAGGVAAGLISYAASELRRPVWQEPTLSPATWVIGLGAATTATAICGYHVWQRYKQDFEAVKRHYNTFKRLWNEPNQKYKYGAVGLTVGTVFALAGTFFTGPSLVFAAVPAAAGSVGYTIAGVRDDFQNSKNKINTYRYSSRLADQLSASRLGALQFSAPPPVSQMLAPLAAIHSLDQILPPNNTIDLTINNQVYKFRNVWSAYFAAKYPLKAGDFVKHHSQSVQGINQFVTAIKASQHPSDRPCQGWDDHLSNRILIDIFAQYFSKNPNQQFAQLSDEDFQECADYLAQAPRDINIFEGLLGAVRDIVRANLSNPISTLIQIGALKQQIGAA